MNVSEAREQLCQGMMQFDHFQKILNEPLLNKYISKYLVDVAHVCEHQTYKRGRILQYYGQQYNKLYFILQGKIALFKPKDGDELQKEQFWINEEDKEYQIKNQEQQNKQNQINQNQASQNNKEKGFRVRGPAKEEQKRRISNISSEDIYKMLRGETVSNKKTPAVRILDAMRDKEDAVLRYYNIYSNQYFKGNLCLFKLIETRSQFQSYGQINFNKTLFKNAEYTAVVSEDAVVLEINGYVYFKICQTLNDKLTFCLQNICKIFKSCNDFQRKEFVLQMNKRTFSLGDCVYKSEVADNNVLYLVKEGFLVYKYDNLLVQNVTQGEFFGHEDLYLNNRKKRFYSVYCQLNHTVVYEIQRGSIEFSYFQQKLKKMGQIKWLELKELIKQLDQEKYQYVNNIVVEEINESFQFLNRSNSQSQLNITQQHIQNIRTNNLFNRYESSIFVSNNSSLHSKILASSVHKSDQTEFIKQSSRLGTPQMRLNEIRNQKLKFQLQKKLNEKKNQISQSITGNNKRNTSQEHNQGEQYENNQNVDNNQQNLQLELQNLNSNRQNEDERNKYFKNLQDQQERGLSYQNFKINKIYQNGDRKVIAQSDLIRKFIEKKNEPSTFYETMPKFFEKKRVPSLPNFFNIQQQQQNNSEDKQFNQDIFNFNYKQTSDSSQIVIQPHGDKQIKSHTAHNNLQQQQQQLQIQQKPLLLNQNVAKNQNQFQENNEKKKDRILQNNFL